jgi:hypothetical protein
MKMNPILIPLKHPLFSLQQQVEDEQEGDEQASACFFCRSEDKDELELYLKENPIAGLTKIISLNQVRKHYVEFKDRKILLSEFTHFIRFLFLLSTYYNWFYFLYFYFLIFF